LVCAYSKCESWMQNISGLAHIKIINEQPEIKYGKETNEGLICFTHMHVATSHAINMVL